MVLNQTIMDKKRLIQAIAVIALEVFPDAKWIAQDGDGRWYAYDVKPVYGGEEWYEPSQTGDILFVLALAEPDASADEIYLIEEILNHAN